MNPPPVITLDFETLPIQQRPEYPPKPVGVAIKWPGEVGRYYAWGHATGNNCSRDEADMELNRCRESGLQHLFHNAKFDCAVAEENFWTYPLRWQATHDTLFLAYLCDPHARSMGLKPLAADLLNWPADEQDELHDWILAHKVDLETTYPQYGKVTKKTAGAWIFAAPGELVGRYAIGDVERTAALFEHLWPLVQRKGMGAAYDRERQLMPILMANEREGIRVNTVQLESDVESYGEELGFVEDWLRNELNASGLNFDAAQDVASVLIQSGTVDAEKFARTQSGKLSVSKETLTPDLFNDPRVASALGYRNRLTTALNTFMIPWLDQACKNKGRITTNWNQTRGDRGGTRTGRPSTDKHNFLNISKNFEGKSDGFSNPDFLGVAHLPLVRKYCLPDEGDVWVHRDFSGQEVRIFAHAEQGALNQAYNDDPLLDPHNWIKDIIHQRTGVELERTRVKNVTFSRLYGGGVNAIQRQARCADRHEAQAISNYHDQALPGRKLVVEEITRLARRGDPIRTMGGRLYYAEPPGLDGRDKIYKLINFWTQGSAADYTKEFMIAWHNRNDRKARFLIAIYDENNASASIAEWEREMIIMREEMETPRFGMTVPMRSEGKVGNTWGDLVKCQ